MTADQRAALKAKLAAACTAAGYRVRSIRFTRSRPDSARAYVSWAADPGRFLPFAFICLTYGSRVAFLASEDAWRTIISVGRIPIEW